MCSVRQTLFIACILTTQGNAGLLFAQSSSAALISLSLADEVDDSSATDESTFDADKFLSYSLHTSPSKRSLAKAAIEHGSCAEIRSFGMTMLKEEDDVVIKVKELAAKRSIYPPITSTTNAGSEYNLGDDKSAEFDRQFVLYAISVLEQDVAMLEQAAECEDRWVRLLASEQLPVVENQLTQLRFIRDKSKQAD